MDGIELVEVWYTDAQLGVGEDDQEFDALRSRAAFGDLVMKAALARCPGASVTVCANRGTRFTRVDRLASDPLAIALDADIDQILDCCDWMVPLPRRELILTKAGRWIWTGPGWYECSGGHFFGEGVGELDYTRIPDYDRDGYARVAGIPRRIDDVAMNYEWFDICPREDIYDEDDEIDD